MKLSTRAVLLTLIASAVGAAACTATQDLGTRATGSAPSDADTGASGTQDGGPPREGDSAASGSADASAPATWQRIDSGVRTDLRSVAGTAADDVWAVGDLGTITHWDGARWSISSSGVKATLRGVWASARNDAWAVGYLVTPSNSSAPDRVQSTMLHWNGAQWSPVDVGDGTKFLSVWGSGRNDVWAVGSVDYTGGHTAYHWNGTQWTSPSRAEDPYNDFLSDGQGRLLRGVWGSGPNDVWAVGFGRYGGAATMRWNGTQWSRTTNDLDEGSATGVWGSGPNDVWALSGAQTSHWNGSAWAAVSNGNTEALNSVWGSSASNVWTVGNYGTVLRWNGGSWARVETPSDGRELHAVWGRAANDVWAVGSYGTVMHYH